MSTPTDPLEPESAHRDRTSTVRVWEVPTSERVACRIAAVAAATLFFAFKLGQWKFDPASSSAPPMDVAAGSASAGCTTQGELRGEPEPVRSTRAASP